MFKLVKYLFKEGIKAEDIEIRDENVEILGKELKEIIDKYFDGSFAIREVDSGSCNACEYEISALTNPYYDIERFGIKFVASPKHADAIMITGCLTRNMYEAVLKAYENVPSPKFVIAVGDCVIDGGIFKGSYAIMDGIKDKLPVDLWIKGCPPEPIDIISGLLILLKGKVNG
ncbi:NADH-quinone oxidoreductase subunit B family protein [Venenivibrio stagnispumantis]|uniref:Ni,Fe-hydrogenase III small subunit n=1 Tax=Venenivibrio stagnispumantis TaxID=407998 RepID=A0AA46ADM7_9AQUI|nr:NADH-quinone oxidoreductase subunit NuoB [Venenivibrio stagnispumantis]MCW4573504.1 NADH-quinone oxidoreductase subunit NuoB [Venenivibrio stagnispumantis]SMP06419.1 Ni,Fe-hydrogenase III small subunit [Venenivibrio stagnispumantis]